ncbi:unnamed protein product [Clonostachys rhizophaga]|uniref:Uncharacterized protein n=1 Tax=Clonostachys rhizophaga TaxID=160324 RepID=A0A9N9YGJ7_9HYPO|nr:unnamed protein product [Clonostachys rhizophaga]
MAKGVIAIAFTYCIVRLATDYYYIGSIGIATEIVIASALAIWSLWLPTTSIVMRRVSEKNDLVSKSRDGSGGAVFLAGKQGYCYDNDDVDWKWDSCEWYKDYGDGPEGSKNCKPGCPSNKVRVSMESTDCKNGAWAYCCSATARTLEKRPNPMLKVYEDSLKTYIKDPTCPANYTESESGLMAVKGFLFGSVQGNSTSSSGLVRRSSSTVTLEGVKDVVDILRDDFVSLDITNLWNDVVGSRFTSLTAANVHEYFRDDLYSLIAIGGFSMAVTYFVCNLESMNVLLGGDTNSPFSCTTSTKNPCDEDDEETWSIFANNPIKWATTDGNGVSFSGQYTKIRWDPTDPVQSAMYQGVYTSPARNCQVINMRKEDMLSERLNGPLSNVDTEHPIEGQTVKLLYEDGIAGRLANSKKSVHSLPGDFVTVTLQDIQILLQLNPVPNPPRGHTSNTNADYHSLEKRLLNALGSRFNTDVFVLADKDLNCMKEKVSFSHYPSKE